MRLSNNEKKVLGYLKNKKKAEAENIEKELNIGIDGVKRSIFFLNEKGLVKMESHKEKKLILTEKGEEALKNGFEEESINKWEGKSVKELPIEIKRKLWVLRESGKVKIKDGEIRVNPGKYILRKIIEEIKKESASKEEKKFIESLEKDGYIKLEKREKISAEITKLGEELDVEDDGNLIGKLSREVILNKTWENKKFKPFNIGKNREMYDIGKEHPLTIAIEKIKQVFLSLGFREMSGNYVESSFWVFDALFQPQDHPSRELADTFYIKGRDKEEIDKELIDKVKEQHEKKWRYKWREEESRRIVLRTHTTALSSRTLYKNKSGKYFAIGRVFRNESVDYKHLAEFHQIEGIVAWKNANFRNLLWLLKEFYSRLGFKKIRFRPSYFPYTEPSLEIETYFEGRKEWIEIGGAGIFRREVVEALDAEYPVLAFGLSLERPLMLMLGIEDIRTFYTNRKKWLDSVPYKKIF